MDKSLPADWFSVKPKSIITVSDAQGIQAVGWFLAIMTRLGYGSMFSEGGCTELNWCERIFNSTDLTERISWAKFLKKGYYVVPPPADDDRPPVDMRWFVEGRDKDVPEANPLPGMSPMSGDLIWPTQAN